MIYRFAVMVSPDRLPCFQAVWFPLGAPGLVPPCILHRRFPFTAGDWHSVPERVRAKQRGVFASRSGCTGLFVNFRIFSSPGVIMKLISNYRLPTFVDMHVANRLLARLV